MATSLTLWKELFAIIVWWIWRWRNNRVFGNDVPSMSDKIRIISRYSTEVISAMENLKMMRGLGSYYTTWIGWNPPVAGWHCLNTNDNVASSQLYAGCGNLLLGDFGNWVACFSKNLGPCSVEEAELWALILGIQLAWDNNMSVSCRD